MAEVTTIPFRCRRIAPTAYRFAAMLLLNDLHSSIGFDSYSADIHQNTNILPVLRNLFQQKPATYADFFVLLHARNNAYACILRHFDARNQRFTYVTLRDSSLEIYPTKNY